jgi:predicted transcriptional regulator/transcriptional regulator with XRE-family HTH domain
MAHAPVGYKIRSRRKSLGLTQAELAKRAGISASYLNLIEADKRGIGGPLLQRVATLLNMEADALTGRAERRIVDGLREIATEPVARQLQLHPESAAELVGRYPQWARALLALHRAYRDGVHTVAALSDRLNRDPFLGETVHRILTNVTAIRSASEILEDGSALEPEQQRRFHAIVSSESGRLSETAQALAAYFDKANTETRALTPADEVDDFLIERGNYFPRLEDAAEALQAALENWGGLSEDACAEYLRSQHRIETCNVSPADADLAEFRNQCRFDPETRTLAFLENAHGSTRRFQMIRHAAARMLQDAIVAETDDARLVSSQARQWAQRALSSYCASAVILPYDAFLETAVAVRYDIEILCRRYAASFEQVCHRLATLRKPANEGIPFAFMRTDPAGYITKRFPLPRLPLPYHGHGCPLWAIYRSLQSPNRVIRQLAAFPDGSRYVMVARSESKQPAAFHEPPVLRAVMLAYDILHADKTVYGDGLALFPTELETPVGPGCRLCARTRCQHRSEDAIVENLGQRWND